MDKIEIKESKSGAVDKTIMFIDKTLSFIDKARIVVDKKCSL